MSAPVDRLAGLLAKLQGAGTGIPASAISASARAALRPLFETGVLREDRQGSGRIVQVGNHVAFAAFIQRHYPSGLTHNAGTATATRAAAVAHLRDAKRATRPPGEPVMVRGFGASVLYRGDQQFSIAELTRTAGVAALLLDTAMPWQGTGTVAVVENLEAFLAVETVIPGLDWAIYASGRLSGHLLTWLAGPALAPCHLVHWGDYDPVGLDEYQRLLSACPGRVELFVPDNLATLLARFGKPDLLAEQTAIFARLRQHSDPTIRALITLLDTHNVGLEQEILLLQPTAHPVVAQ